MTLNIELSNKEKFLFALYKVKEGTFREISEQAGVDYKSGLTYKIKGNLIDMGILVPLYEKKYSKKKDKCITVYKVEHGELDRFFCCDFETKILYQRFLNGQIPVIPTLKSLIKETEME